MFKGIVGVQVTLQGVPDLPPPEHKRLLEAHLDDVLDHLLALDDAIDPDIDVTFSKGLVEFSLWTNADSQEQAEVEADALVRSAIHAAGGFTQEWWSLDWNGPPQERLLADA